MITPLEIQNKAFGKGVRGYKEEEVDAFLDMLTLDMEKLISENQQLKQQISKQNEDILRYQGSEGAVLETLAAAKELMSDISTSSEKRAEILLKNAELDAELITREAKESVERLKEEAASLESKVSSFRMRYRNLLETELEKFDTLTQELFEEIQMERWQSSSGKTSGAGATAGTTAGALEGAERKKTGTDTKSMQPGQAADMARTMLNLRIREEA